MINSEKIISRFRVNKIFGRRNIEILFDSSERVILASNGTGKTTIINMLFHLLKGNFHKLLQFDFESIEIEFGDGTDATLLSAELESAFVLPSLSDMPISVSRIVSRIDQDLLVELVDKIRNARSSEVVRRSSMFMTACRQSGVPSSEMSRALSFFERNSHRDLFSSPVALEVRDVIKSKFDFEIMFLPTYRRVEEDLSNLGLSLGDAPRSESLINFGMGDVKNRFDAVLRQISDSTLSFYQQMSGRMLDELVKGLSASVNYEALRDPDAVTRLLGRVATGISSGTRESIINMVSTGAIEKSESRPLAYFLTRLSQINNERERSESRVMEFASVINGYLEDKLIVYNADDMNISIRSRRDGAVIDLEKLSSGEKQLLSLFSQLYFAGEKKIAMLFDEPELSLSMEWQEKLLPDIRASNSCAFLLVATHSPFIFNNDFRLNTNPILVEEV